MASNSSHIQYPGNATIQRRFSQLQIYQCSRRFGTFPKGRAVVGKAVFLVYIYIYFIPGTQMTSIFAGQPSKTRPKFQSKQGSFGFQVHIMFWGVVFLEVQSVEALVILVPYTPSPRSKLLKCETVKHTVNGHVLSIHTPGKFKTLNLKLEVWKMHFLIFSGVPS